MTPSIRSVDYPHHVYHDYDPEWVPLAEADRMMLSPEDVFSRLF